MTDSEVQVYWFIYTHLDILVATLNPDQSADVLRVMTLRGEPVETHPFLGQRILGVSKGTHFDTLCSLEDIPHFRESDGYRLKIRCGNVDIFSDVIMHLDLDEELMRTPRTVPPPPKSASSAPSSNPGMAVSTIPPPTRRDAKPSPKPTSVGPPPTRREGSSGIPPPIPSRRGK